MKPLPIALIVACSIWSASARADVKLSAVFSEHMVLQRDAPVAVWGRAEPGEQVLVEFHDQQKTVAADGDGNWIVRLDALSASKEPRALRVQCATQNPRDAILIKDVLVGDVWLCAGQTNMEWTLSRSAGGPEAAEGASNPLLRLGAVSHNSKPSPRDEVAVKWTPSSPAAARNFSAIAWWFGVKLERELDLPVGVISASFGAAPIQSWIPLATLRNGPWPQDKQTDFELAKADYDHRIEKFRPVLEKYLAARAEAIKDLRPLPELPKGWPGDFRGPGMLWNGMIAPLLKLPIRGVVWHHGESNATVAVASHYAPLLAALIADWRAGFAQPDLPFVVVQIASSRKPQIDPNEPSAVALVQEAQARIVSQTPRAALVVTRDLGEEDLHYKKKEPAAERAVRAALALVYGRNERMAVSPTFQSARFEGNKATLRFANAGEGLMAKGGALAGFAVAGEDRNFVFATARVAGDSVIVDSPQARPLAAVRYAWADFPKANLYSKRGLPAAPFRTDDWATLKPPRAEAPPAGSAAVTQSKSLARTGSSPANPSGALGGDRPTGGDRAEPRPAEPRPADPGRAAEPGRADHRR